MASDSQTKGTKKKYKQKWGDSGHITAALSTHVIYFSLAPLRQFSLLEHLVIHREWPPSINNTMKPCVYKLGWQTKEVWNHFWMDTVPNCRKVKSIWKWWLSLNWQWSVENGWTITLFVFCSVLTWSKSKMVTLTLTHHIIISLRNLPWFYWLAIWAKTTEYHYAF